MKKLVFVVIALITFVACQKDKDEDSLAGRTVLVYMAAENNLGYDELSQQRYRYANEDLIEIKEGVKNIGNNHLVIYVDKCSDPDAAFNDPTPYILHFHNGELKDSIPMEETLTADASILETVARKAFTSWPAKSYALSFWGHGTGWIIKSDSVKYNARKRAYGGDTGDNTYRSAGRYWMNIPSMKLTLSRLPHLDYIFFDCCNMMCLEVAYELRHATDYILGSPAEIPAVGAPYHQIVTAMFNQNISSVYTTIIDQYRYATSLPLSCIKTSEMENLASATKTVLNTMQNKFVDDEGKKTYPNMADLIHYYYDYSSKQEFYDANDFFLKFADDANYMVWKQALDKAVVYKKIASIWDTNKWWTTYYNDFEMTDQKFGGVSMYVPTYYQQLTENKTIQQMGWYYAAGYSEIGW